jgi:hypothetical protein
MRVAVWARLGLLDSASLGWLPYRRITEVLVAAVALDHLRGTSAVSTLAAG